MPPVLTTSSINSVGIPSLISTTVPQPIPLPVPAPQPISIPAPFQDVDLRNVDHRIVDPRLNRNAVPAPLQPLSMDLDMRVMPNPVAVGMEINNFPPRGVPAPQQPPQRPVQPFQTDPRQRPADPRQKAAPVAPPALQRGSSIIPDSASDAEKAALIMQVLQLSDEQIAMLPPEQRTSILVLKEQIAKSTNQQR